MCNAFKEWSWFIEIMVRDKADVLSNNLLNHALIVIKLIIDKC